MRHANTFEKGLAQDPDKAFTQPGYYIYSFNGRVHFNENGEGAWKNSKGTSLAIITTPEYGAVTQYSDYRIIGGAEVPAPVIAGSDSALLVFLTNEINSEIGLISYSGVTPSYQTIFNDLFDPHGDKLNLSVAHCIRRARVIFENSATIRAYWTDFNNVKRSLNIALGIPFNFAPAYPSWYSVHAMADTMEHRLGIFKLKKTVGGTLLSGRYEYFYRSISKSGYATSWSPGSGKFMLPTDTPTSINTNHYQFGASGQQTGKGLRLEIVGADQRFDYVEIAYCYWETDDAIAESKIIQRLDTAPSIEFSHSENAGTDVTVSELIVPHIPIEKVKDFAFKKNRKYDFNLVSGVDLTLDLSNASAKPVIRHMMSDIGGRITPGSYPGQFIVDPFTSFDQVKRTKYRSMVTSLDVDELYDIKDDFTNYKGIQWEHLFQSYWRGEWVPLAIVIYDLYGNPWFAQHITDLYVPEQYESQYRNVKLPPASIPNSNVVDTDGIIPVMRLTNSIKGKYLTENTSSDGYSPTIQMCGIKINGIDFGKPNDPNNKFFKNGKPLFSGFSIVRMERQKKILYQGLLFNTVGPFGTEARPHTTPHNAFHISSSLGTSSYFVPYTSPFQFYKDDSNNTQFLRPYVFTFESPDTAVLNPDTPTLNNEYRMKFVGVAAGISNQDPIQNYAGGNSDTWITKLYCTEIGAPTSLLVTDWASDGDGVHALNNLTLGYKYIIDKWRIEDMNSEYDDIVGGIKFVNTPYHKQGSDEYQGIGNRGVLALGMRDMAKATLKLKYHPFLNAGHEAGWAGVFNSIYEVYDCFGIFNIVNSNSSDAPVLNKSVLANRTYKYIGHFQPVDDSVIADVTITGGPLDGHVHFTEIEIFGGDCYADYVQVVKVYNDLSKTGGNDHPAGCGLMFPMESNKNWAMRYGNTLSEKKLKAPLGPGYENPGGLYGSPTGSPFLEDFNINVLMKNIGSFNEYAGLNTFLPLIFEYPVRGWASDTKIYGEEIDNYRVYKANNFRDADGACGEINYADTLFGQLYVIQRSGFSSLETEAKYAQSTAEGEIIAAVGGILAEYRYITKASGTQHQFSAVNSGKAIYWTDADKGIIQRFASDGLADPSDIRFLEGYTKATTKDFIGVDAPLTDGGITGFYDVNNHAYVATFCPPPKNIKGGSDESPEPTPAFSLEYNEMKNAFTGLFGTLSPIAIPFKRWILMPHTARAKSHILHNYDEGSPGEYFDVFEKSILTFVVNPNAGEPKIFDNMRLGLNEDGSLAGVGCSLYMSSGGGNAVLDLLNNTQKVRTKQNFLCFPLRGDTIFRQTGKHLTLRFEFTNTGQPVKISLAETTFRLSPRL